mgnify:CR=1 FL=1|jgi:hypothetical protein
MTHISKKQKIESDSEHIWSYKEINSIGEDINGNTIVFATYKSTYHHPKDIPTGFDHTIGKMCEYWTGCNKVEVIWKPYWQPIGDFPEDIRFEIEDMIRISDKMLKEKEEKYKRFLNIFREQLYEKGKNKFTRNLYNEKWVYINSVGRNIGKVTNCCFCNITRICAYSIKFNKKSNIYDVGSDCLKKMINLRERKPLLADYKRLLFSYKNLKTEKETLMFMKKITTVEEKLHTSQTEYGHILNEIAKKYS